MAESVRLMMSVIQSWKDIQNCSQQSQKEPSEPFNSFRNSNQTPKTAKSRSAWPSWIQNPDWLEISELNLHRIKNSQRDEFRLQIHIQSSSTRDRCWRWGDADFKLNQQQLITISIEHWPGKGPSPRMMLLLSQHKRVTHHLEQHLIQLQEKMHVIMLWNRATL